MGGDAPQTPRLRVGSARAFCPVPFAPCLLPRAFCPVSFAPCPIHITPCPRHLAPCRLHKPHFTPPPQPRAGGLGLALLAGGSPPSSTPHTACGCRRVHSNISFVQAKHKHIRRHWSRLKDSIRAKICFYQKSAAHLQVKE